LQTIYVFLNLTKFLFHGKAESEQHALTARTAELSGKVALSGTRSDGRATQNLDDSLCQAGLTSTAEGYSR